MMTNQIDLHSCVCSFPLLKKGEKASQSSGVLTARYEVRRYENVRNLESRLCYYVICTARITLPNTATRSSPNPRSKTSDSSAYSYKDYPVILTHQTTLTQEGGEPVPLHDYSPKTINASVSADTSSGVQSQRASSVEHSSGSSDAQTNSFTANVSVGLVGDMLSGNAGGAFSHSSTRSEDRSVTRGQQTGTSADESTSDSMSIKDWASYGVPSKDRSTVTWTWGQEYPWNAIDYSELVSTGSSTIALPSFVQQRLATVVQSSEAKAEKSPSVTYQARPPSALSLFGLDIVMKAVWLVDASGGDSFSIGHEVGLTTGSHTVAQKNGLVSASITPQVPYPVPEEHRFMSLSQLALDPIRGASRCRGS